MTMQLTLDQFGQQLEKFGLDEALLAKGRVNNFLSSVQAYADMSPDLTIRREVNSWMMRRDRTPLDCDQWCDLFSHSFSNSVGNSQCPTEQSVLAFVYETFSDYSGLDFSRVRPNDSLNNHLHFPLVCWFDWTITFCEDFFQAFGLDLSDRFDEADFSTIGELASFLVQQVSISPVSISPGK